MRAIKLVGTLVIVALMPLILGSCGGGSVVSPATGTIAVSVRFPESSRLIPANTRAVRLQLRHDDTPVATALIPRQGNIAQHRFTNLVAGTYTLIATTHADNEGQTTATARGIVSVEVRPSEVRPVSLNLASTVVQLRVAPQMATVVRPGARIPFGVVGLNADAEYVPLSPDRIRWSSSNPAVATVDQNGVVRVVSIGTTTITAYDEESQRSGSYNLTSGGEGGATAIPAGEWILFSEMVDSTKARLVAVSPDDATNTITLTAPASGLGDKYATYRAGGDYLAFVRIQSNTSNELRAFNWRTGETIMLDSGLIWPVFSTDANTAVYAKKVGSQWDLFEVPLAGGAPRRITNTAEDELDPCLSPDGTRIVCVKGRQLVEVNRATGAPNLLPMGNYLFAFFPTYTPDGQNLVFVARLQNEVHLAALLGRTTVRQLSTNVVRFALRTTGAGVEVLFARLSSDSGMWLASLSGSARRVSGLTPKLGFAISPDQSRAVLCDSSFKVRMLNLDTGADSAFANASYILPLWTTFGTRAVRSGSLGVPAADTLLAWRGTGLLPHHYEELLNLLR
jgi:hypothetical protein